MDRDKILNCINRRDYANLLRSYCIEMGKDPNLTEKFILLTNFVNMSYYINYTVDYYCKKFDITLVLDKNGNFINAF